MSGPSWLGLLRWSLQQQDAAASPDAKELSAEDKQWLREALQHLVKDDVERLTQINAELKKVHDADAEVDYEALIDELRDITEQIDMATIFVRIGGIRHLLAVLTTESNVVSVETRAQAAAALSTLAQNNPETQHMLMSNTFQRRKGGDESKNNSEEIIEGGVVATLQRAFFATDDAVIRTRIVQALSAMVRGQGEFEERLCADDENIRILHASISDNNNPRLQSKAAFVSKALLTADSCTATRVLRLLPVVAQAVPMIANDDADLREQAQSLLLAACRRGAAAHILRLVDEADAREQVARAESIAQAELDSLPEDEDRTLAENYMQLVQQLRSAFLERPAAGSSVESDAAPSLAQRPQQSQHHEESDAREEEKRPVLQIQNPGPSAAPPGP